MIPDLLKELNELDEHPNLEAKSCRVGVLGNSFFETVCAFSNEPGLGGGRIVLGVTKNEDEDLFGGYEVCGVKNPDKLQQDIASGCSEKFNVPIRPRMILENRQGKPVVIVEVDERAPNDKPVYLVKQGLPRGAWRRIGSTDQRCTADDMAVFYGDRKGGSYDLSLLSHAGLNDLDPDAIEHYKTLRRKVNSGAEELTFSDHELLQALNAIRREDGVWKPTLTGLLLFGSRLALRRELPMVRVDYIRVAGKEWIGDPDRRFETTIDMRGPLLQLVDRVLAAVMDDLPKGFELKEGRVQSKTPTLPTRVLREAIVNALMHRSYREHQPTQIIRYSNRIEIKNAGFSLKNEDRLGEPGSELRNPNLAAVFHDTNVAETKGSGIRTMRRLMRQNGFSPPTFESNRGDNYFVGRLLLHHFLSEEDLVWLRLVPHELSDSQRMALIFAREQGAVDNRTLRQLTATDVLSASHDLRKLRDLGLLVQKGKGSATYYTPGPGFPPSGEIQHAGFPSEHTGLDNEHTGFPSGHAGLDSESGRRASKIPEHLRQIVATLGGRPRRQKLREAVLALCQWKALGATSLCEILGRKDPDHLKRTILAPMVKSGQLEYLYPDMERHPRQAYRIPDSRNLAPSADDPEN